jgi:pyruvate dehydrogenase (quinone)
VPFCTGSIGLLGTKPSWDMMQGADTLLMVGSSFPYSEFLPKEGRVKAVQIDLLGRMLSIRYPMDLALEGDSKESLKELLPLLRRKEDRSWQEEIEENVADGRSRPARRPQWADPSAGAVRGALAAAS